MSYDHFFPTDPISPEYPPPPPPPPPPISQFSQYDHFFPTDPISPEYSPTSQFSRPLPLPKPYVWESDPYCSERLPETLASGIQRFLRVGNLVESEEPRIAYLCRFFAFEETLRIDRSGTGKGVRQFRMSLLERLEKDSDLTLSRRKEKSDAQELKRVYHAYKEYIIRHGATFNLDDSQREKLIDAHRIASVLDEVLKVVNTTDDNKSTPENIESKQDEESGESPDMVTLKALEDLILTSMSQGDASVQSNPPQAAIDAIDKEEVQINKGGREVRPRSPVPSSFYEDKYVETQEKLNMLEKKIEEMDLKLKDVDFWTNLMQNMLPDQVPLSMRASPTENNNNE